MCNNITRSVESDVGEHFYRLRPSAGAGKIFQKSVAREVGNERKIHSSQERIAAFLRSRPFLYTAGAGGAFPVDPQSFAATGSV